MASTSTNEFDAVQNFFKQDSQHECSLIIQQADHFKSLKDFKAHENLKDVTIEVEEQRFRAHKVILASSIPYFDETFQTCAFGTIRVEGVNAEAMNSIINYTYTGEIEVTEKNIFSVLKCATVLKIETLIHSCTTFVTDLMRHHFVEISIRNDYLDLDYKVLKHILSNAEIQASTQSIFEGIMRWITHNYEERNRHIPSLLGLINYGDLSPSDIENYLFEIEENGICHKHKELAYVLFSSRYQSEKQKKATNNLKENSEVDIGYQSSGECSRNKTIINDLKEELFVDNMEDNSISDDVTVTENNSDETSSEYVSNNFPTRDQSENVTRNESPIGISKRNSNGLREKTKRNPNKKIFVISLDQSHLMETYEPDTNTWTPVKIEDNCKNLGWFGCTTYDGKLYKFGGLKVQKKSDKHFETVEVFDSNKCRWKELEPMITARRECGSTSWMKSLYVCGGWTGKEILNKVERYSFETKKWKQIAPMKERRCAPSVIAFENCIYAIGGVGRTGTEISKAEYLDTIEVYDITKGEWSILEAKMEIKRSSCGAALLNEKFYICGGWNGTSLNVVEMFDPKLKKWTTLASMNKGRKQFLVVAYAEKLWAIGGARCDAWVEVYDPDENRWSCVERKIVNSNFYLTGGLL